MLFIEVSNMFMKVCVYVCIGVNEAMRLLVMVDVFVFPSCFFFFFFFKAFFMLTPNSVIPKVWQSSAEFSLFWIWCVTFRFSV